MNLDTIKRLKHPVFNFKIQADEDHGICWVCGQVSDFEYEENISDDLTRQWGIGAKDRHAFSSRETRHCQHCGAIHRNRQMAKALCELYGDYDIKNFKELLKSPAFKKLSIAEINACGYLHQFLKDHPKLKYSEFESSDKTIRSEDLQKLSYKDSTFDLVLTSDTLEHVPDYKKAFKEIHRVLKPGGRHIFTIPIVWSWRTRRRAEMSKGGKIKYLLEPSYHGPPEDANLVWTDFGSDVLPIIDDIGFNTSVMYYNLLNSHDASRILISTK